MMVKTLHAQGNCTFLSLRYFLKRRFFFWEPVLLGTCVALRVSCPGLHLANLEGLVTRALRALSVQLPTTDAYKRKKNISVLSRH